MTPTFDFQVYATLLSKVLPQAITTEAENERALATVEALMHKTELTPEEDWLYDLLLVFLGRFEQESYPLQNLSTPHSRLLHPLESNHL
jgi:HTH-type transcriptional regulator / antitoxin HigA